jgi:hypothetical protein
MNAAIRFNRASKNDRSRLTYPIERGEDEYCANTLVKVIPTKVESCLTPPVRANLTVRDTL